MSDPSLLADIVVGEGDDVYQYPIATQPPARSRSSEPLLPAKKGGKRARPPLLGDGALEALPDAWTKESIALARSWARRTSDAKIVSWMETFCEPDQRAAAALIAVDRATEDPAAAQRFFKLAEQELPARGQLSVRPRPRGSAARHFSLRKVPRLLRSSCRSRRPGRGQARHLPETLPMRRLGNGPGVAISRGRSLR